MSVSDAGQQQRATIVSLLLPLIMSCSLVVVLFAACGGLAFHILGVIAGTTALGFVHYWLWGRSLSQNVAGERQAEMLRDQFLEDEDLASK